MTDGGRPEGPPPRRPTLEQQRILSRLGLALTDPWVWISTDGPISADRTRARIDDGERERWISLTEEGAKAWNGYSFDLLGTKLSTERMILGRMQPWADDLTLDTRYMRMRHQQSPLYAEYIASDYEDEDAAIRGLLLRHGAADREKARAALSLILDDPPIGHLGGRYRLEESPTSPWRSFAERAVEMMRADPNLSIRDAAVRLGLPDYERSYDPGSAGGAEERAELSAERKLRRWIERLHSSSTNQ